VDEDLVDPADERGLGRGERLLDRREGVFVVDVVAGQIVLHEVECARVLGAPEIQDRLPAAVPGEHSASAPQKLAAHPARQNGWTVDLGEPGRGRVGPEARRRRAVEVEIPVVGWRPGQQRSPVGRRIHPHHRKDVRQTGQHVVPRLPGAAPCIGHEGENSHIGDEGRTGHVFQDATGGSVTRQLQVRGDLRPRGGHGQ
jgi:hypothetical protein